MTKRKPLEIIGKRIADTSKLKLKFHTEVEKLITTVDTLATNHVTIQSSPGKCFRLV